MKKLFAILLSCALAVTLCACKSPAEKWDGMAQQAAALVEQENFTQASQAYQKMKDYYDKKKPEGAVSMEDEREKHLTAYLKGDKVLGGLLTGDLSAIHGEIGKDAAASIEKYVQTATKKLEEGNFQSLPFVVKLKEEAVSTGIYFKALEIYQKGDATANLTTAVDLFQKVKENSSKFGDSQKKIEEIHNTLFARYIQTAEEALGKLDFDAANNNLTLAREIANNEQTTDLQSRIQTAEQEEKARQEAERLEAERMQYETGITFDQLSRDPDAYNGKKVKFSGYVLQVTEGSSEYQIRLATSGKYDNVIFLSINKKLPTQRILEDDYITVKGTSKGLYTSVMGASKTLPLVFVEAID